MMGVSAARDFTNYYPEFNSTITSFKQLTDPSKLNKKPDRIRVKPVKQSGTLSQVLTSMGAKNDKLKELAVLNGMQLNDKIEQGSLLKVIEQ